jgi:hypothetical protein
MGQFISFHYIRYYTAHKLIETGGIISKHGSSVRKEKRRRPLLFPEEKRGNLKKSKKTSTPGLSPGIATYLYPSLPASLDWLHRVNTWKS